MKRPPQKFFEEYQLFRERFEWAERGLADGDLVQSQLTHAEMSGFLDRWQGKMGLPEFESVFAALRSPVEQIARLLEAKYLEALAALLEKRHSVLVEPAIFEAGVAYIRTLQAAPEALRPELERIFREHNGYDFDAERYYRESEGALEEYTAEYEEALAKMEVDWPNPLTAEIRARLALAPIEEINQWKAEIATQLKSVEAKIEAAQDSAAG